jgi:hypothetical protein
MLGALAEQSAGERARAQWELTHAPSLAIWRHALSAKGWETIADEADRQRAARSLPASFDRESSVWLSSDRQYLAAFGEGGGETPWFFRPAVARARPRPPRAAADWTRVGTGWEAFEKALAQVAAPLALQRPPTPARARDPRALDY